MASMSCSALRRTKYPSLNGTSGADASRDATQCADCSDERARTLDSKFGHLVIDRRIRALRIKKSLYSDVLDVCFQRPRLREQVGENVAAGRFARGESTQQEAGQKMLSFNAHSDADLGRIAYLVLTRFGSEASWRRFRKEREPLRRRGSRQVGRE